VVISETGVNIPVICVRMAPYVIHSKLHASVRPDGLDLPVTNLVPRYTDAINLFHTRG